MEPSGLFDSSVIVNACESWIDRNSKYDGQDRDFCAAIAAQRFEVDKLLNLALISNRVVVSSSVAAIIYDDLTEALM